MNKEIEQEPQLKSYEIAVLPGDGIGVEVTAVALDMLKTLGPKIERHFNTVIHPAGAQHYLDSGDALPASTLDACKKRMPFCLVPWACRTFAVLMARKSSLSWICVLHLIYMQAFDPFALGLACLFR